MSEPWVDEAAATSAPPPAGGDTVTAGALLRRAREAAGLHVAALAVSLKVPVRKLEALEGDRWDLLPDAVFVRALASSVCRTLKIDAQPVLELLPQTVAPRLMHDDEGINTPFRAPSDGAPPSWFDQMTRPVFLAVFALLLGALVLILLPTTRQEAQLTTGTGPDASAPVAPLGSAPGATDAAASLVTTPTLAPAVAAEPGGTAPAASSPQASAVPLARATPLPVESSAPASAGMAASAAGVSPAPAVTAASGIVVFRTKGPSWVEVTDAKGSVAMRKVLEAGEAAGASGALPLQVTVGRVDQTEVQVRGKPFDLRPVSRDNIARFEVK